MCDEVVEIDLSSRGSAPFSDAVAVVDADDYDRLKLGRYAWYARWNVNRRKKYAWAIIDGSNVQLGRMILGLSTGDGWECDHIDGDTLNNRRENLRIVTSSQNQWNTSRYQNNTVGYKGVFDCSEGPARWRAEIGFLGVIYKLGNYKTKKRAARIYDYASYHLHGEYGRRNFKELRIKSVPKHVRRYVKAIKNGKLCDRTLKDFKPTRHAKFVRAVKKLGGQARCKQVAEVLGKHNLMSVTMGLCEAVKAGELVRVSRGLYGIPEHTS